MTLARSVAVLAVCAFRPDVFGCSSPPPRLAQFHLTINGYGCVDAALVNAACDGGMCSGGSCNPGTTGAAYEPNTAVNLSAQANSGWHFVSWRITAYAGTSILSNF